MAENLNISVKRNGRVFSWDVARQMCVLAVAPQLLAWEGSAIERLFEGDVRPGAEPWGELEGPGWDGIICIDFDAKRIDDCGSYGRVGQIMPGIRVSGFKEGWLAGQEPEAYTAGGLILDAFMAGYLRLDGGPLGCLSKNRLDAMLDLSEALAGVGDGPAMQRLRIVPRGWAVVDWDPIRHGGSAELAKGLLQRGWSLGRMALEQWRDLCLSRKAPDAGEFGQWVGSIQERGLIGDMLSKHSPREARRLRV